MIDRDHDDYLLNIEDLDQLEEIMDVFLYEKCKMLIENDIISEDQEIFFPIREESFDCYKRSKRKIKKEMWNFLKDEYFEDVFFKELPKEDNFRI